MDYRLVITKQAERMLDNLIYYLLHKEYGEAVLPDMNCLVIYKVEGKVAYVLGVFHESEKYWNKL